MELADLDWHGDRWGRLLARVLLDGNPLEDLSILVGPGHFAMIMKDGRLHRDPRGRQRPARRIAAENLYENLAPGGFISLHLTVWRDDALVPEAPRGWRKAAGPLLDLVERRTGLSRGGEPTKQRREIVGCEFGFSGCAGLWSLFGRHFNYP